MQEHSFYFLCAKANGNHFIFCSSNPFPSRRNRSSLQMDDVLAELSLRQSGSYSSYDPSSSPVAEAKGEPINRRSAYATGTGSFAPLAAPKDLRPRKLSNVTRPQQWFDFLFLSVIMDITLSDQRRIIGVPNSARVSSSCHSQRVIMLQVFVPSSRQ